MLLCCWSIHHNQLILLESAMVVYLRVTRLHHLLHSHLRPLLLILLRFVKLPTRWLLLPCPAYSIGTSKQTLVSNFHPSRHFHLLHFRRVSCLLHPTLHHQLTQLHFQCSFLRIAYLQWRLLQNCRCCWPRKSPSKRHRRQHWPFRCNYLTRETLHASLVYWLLVSVDCPNTECLQNQISIDLNPERGLLV